VTDAKPFSEPSEPDDKLDVKRILPIFLIVFVDLLGLTIIIPVLPLYSRTFGMTPLVYGLLAATYPVMQFIGAPILGRLSDRYGRKPVLMFSQLGTLIGFILLGLANGIPLLFLSRAIDGASGGNISVAQAAIADVTTEKTRTQGLGLIGAAFGLGFIFGPVIAGIALTLTNNDYRVPAFIAAACSLASIILTGSLFKETVRKDVNAQDKGSAARRSFSLGVMVTALRHPAVGLLLVLICMQQVAFFGFEQLFALFTLNKLGLNATGNALIFTYVGFLAVLVQGYYIGRWSRRYGERRLILATLFLLAVGLLMVGVTPESPVPWYSQEALADELAQTANRVGAIPGGGAGDLMLPDEANSGWFGFVWIMLAMIPVSIGGGSLQPAINSLITKRVSLAEVGSILGISAAFLSLANIIAPLMGGALFEVAPAVPFLAWGVLAAIMFVVAALRLKPGAEEQKSPGLARGGGGH
jgi:DHA1 family tetracycline resistance protein-like MFS transporter